MSADISHGAALARELVGKFLAWEALGTLASVVMVTAEPGQWQKLRVARRPGTPLTQSALSTRS